MVGNSRRIFCIETKQAKSIYPVRSARYSWYTLPNAYDITLGSKTESWAVCLLKNFSSQRRVARIDC